ncbi:putative two component transcriptional regulator, winged helix family precursor [Bradyrhizobium sp. ORS 285]|uniref:response regulator transcription factor n=1 Tax=Bradyrhizobium sp. ORS 285 TaxID=115808 RepID=UPI000240790A|nr:response regulator transcription factor [Bradyrhizobium sp. ORS 285]CCD87932.1 putative two component transcriptional regulator, winged helix family precursor [Bradyrhizobium sp. ORS 285]SMX56566.1 putative two component transcriptional regulator, winged helix family precursor [Bradyrhizobium sp. ORS 285]
MDSIAIITAKSSLRYTLDDCLRAQGFHVLSFACGSEIDRVLATDATPDIILIDSTLPKESALSLCQRLHQMNAPPIIALIDNDAKLPATDNFENQALFLEIGADDCISTPFTPRVLIARIRAVLRRSIATSNYEVYRSRHRILIGDLVINLDARAITLRGSYEQVQLSRSQYDLLHCFFMRPQRQLSREKLLEWTRGGAANVFDRSIDVQISRIRQKLHASGSCVAAMLKSIRNAGYILDAPVHPDDE